MKDRSSRQPKDGSARESGFTMIELMIVIAIITILATLLITGIGSLTQRARRKKTEVMMSAIDNALSAYFADFRDYPPDGFDLVPGATVTGAGIALPPVDAVTLTADTSAAGLAALEPRKNSACLIYFLMLRHVKTTRMGADGTGTSAFGTQTMLVGPYLPFETLQRDNYSLLTAGGIPRLDDPTCELVDGFSFPIEYDRVPRGVRDTSPATIDANDLQVRDGDPTPFHPDAAMLALVAQLVPAGKRFNADGNQPDEDGNVILDPRRPAVNADGDKVSGTANAADVRSVNVASYDVWSHGPSWTNPRDDIGNTGQ